MKESWPGSRSRRTQRAPTAADAKTPKVVNKPRFLGLGQVHSQSRGSSPTGCETAAHVPKTKSVKRPAAALATERAGRRAPVAANIATIIAAAAIQPGP